MKRETKYSICHSRFPFPALNFGNEDDVLFRIQSRARRFLRQQFPRRFFPRDELVDVVSQIPAAFANEEADDPAEFGPTHGTNVINQVI